jgi:biotin carboxylase
MWVVAVCAAAPCAASAQSALAVADAAAFMGKWTIAIQSPQGAFEQELDVKDESGKVVAEITNQMQTTPQKISDVSKTGADLVLKFSGDFQGTAFSAKITMTPDGDNKAKVVFDVMDGQITLEGTGTKK